MILSLRSHHGSIVLKSWLSLRLSISWLVIKGDVFSVLSLRFTAALIHFVFKISSLYELKPKSMYGNLMLRDVRTQVEITLFDVGEAASLFVMCVMSAISQHTASWLQRYTDPSFQSFPLRSHSAAACSRAWKSMSLNASDIEVTVHVFRFVTPFQNIKQQMNVSSLFPLRGIRKRRIRLCSIFGGIVFIREEYIKDYVAKVSKAVSVWPSYQCSLEAT